MNYMNRMLRTAILALAVALVALLAVPVFGQTTDISTWNGGTGFWNVSSEWMTNGQLGIVYPNNTASTVFNVIIDSGQQDIVTLSGPPAITINSLTLDGNPTFSSTLAIGENGGAAGMLTIGSDTSPALLTVGQLGNLDVNGSSELVLDILSGNGAVINNGIINVGSASGEGRLGISDGGNAHQLILSGSGTVALSDNPNNLITGVTGTETLVNDVGETISGAGTISNLALVNNGTIIANGANALNIEPNSGGFTNNGTLQVNSGSPLAFNIAAGNATVTNNGAINLDSASGTGSSLLIDDAGNMHQLTLSGTGVLTMQPSSLIHGVSGDGFLQNNSTIQGAGTISNLFLVNNGTIDANGTAPLVIDSNPNTVPEFGLGAHNGTGFINGGTVEVSAGST
ncbi:MAG: hypothetical protein ACRD3O_21485, partial [Terriglobia bacterium]